MKNLAPIILFVYNRVDNTSHTIEHLLRNTLARESELYIFSDGGRDEKSWEAVNKVRAYLKTIEGFKAVHIVERPCNYYLERNVIEGIAEVFTHHDRIIVLEDDICTSPHFLTFINEALTLYEQEKRVMHISGFTNLDIPHMGDTYFTRRMTGWGWATWRDRWEKFVHFTSRDEALQGFTEADIQRITYNGNFGNLSSLDKKPIPWDICWELALYRNHGLALNPTQTLVRNIGLATGTHFGWKNSKLFGWYEFDRPYTMRKLKVGGVPIEENPEIEAYNAAALIDHGMRYNLLGRIVRKIYKSFKKKK